MIIENTTVENVTVEDNTDLFDEYPENLAIMKAVRGMFEPLPGDNDDK